MKSASIRWMIIAVGCGALGACSGQRGRPSGPPPEYEPPQVMAWDAGAPKDPLESAGEGDWVDEEDEAGAGDAETDADRP